MEAIDMDRLKTGEVNLGVCPLSRLLVLALHLYIGLIALVDRPQSWPSNSMAAWLSAQTVGRQQEVTSCVSLSRPHLIAELRRRRLHRQANRVTDKLTFVHDRIYCCRSGSAADTQAIADVVHMALQQFAYVLPPVGARYRWSTTGMCRQFNNGPPSVHIAATLFESICYSNKDGLSAGIIVAGWDKEVGPSVYNIPLGGGLFRQPWAIGGSGSSYVYGYCDATYKEDWGRDETVQFVKNSKLPLASNERLRAHIAQRSRWPWLVMVHQEASFVWP